MSKMKIVIFILFAFLIQSNIYGQEDEALFTRLRGISNEGIDFFNIDGIDIASQKVDIEFSAKNCAETVTKITKKYFELAEKFSLLNIEELETGLTTSDSLLPFRNYYVYKSHEAPQKIFRNITYYFVESSDKKLIIITFASINKRDSEFERNFINLLYNNRIPESVYSYKSSIVDSINFAGRAIPLPLKYMCKWKGVNNLQSYRDGQMNWSIHKNLEDASATTNNQFLITSRNEECEMLSDTTVHVTFEGVETTARKVTYQITGEFGSLLQKSGSNILIIYYVAAPVRNNYISCVMSFWESDLINLNSGLPFLLEQVMKLE